MNRTSSTRGARAPHWAACTLFMAVLFMTVASGCRDADVIAEVGSTALRRSDLDEFSSLRAPGAETAEAQLDALIGRTRLAEQAIALGLDDREDVRARLAAARREVLAQALLQHELTNVTSEATLRARFEASKDSWGRRQIHVRHILVRVASDADAAARRIARDRANVLYARISGGEDFDAVAREASHGEVATEHSADMGVLQEGQVHPSFFEAAAALKKDELSKPFETPYGIHVVQARAPVETVIPAFDEVRGRLAADARREAETRLMADLESRIAVMRFPEAMTPPDAGAVGDGASGGREGR